jgi:hypothetical protein
VRKYFFTLFLLISTVLFSVQNSVIARVEKDNGVTMLDHQLRQEIFTDASKLSGYTIPEILPEIHRVSHRVIVNETCGEDECSRYAAAAPNKPILVDETLDLNKVEDYSFVLHEAIHVLQFAAKGITDIESLSCNETLALEKEAYHLQQKYLEKQRAFLRVTWMIDRISCPNTP